MAWSSTLRYYLHRQFHSSDAHPAWPLVSNKWYSILERPVHANIPWSYCQISTTNHHGTWSPCSSRWDQSPTIREISRAKPDHSNDTLCCAPRSFESRLYSHWYRKKSRNLVGLQPNRRLALLTTWRLPDLSLGLLHHCRSSGALQCLTWRSIVGESFRKFSCNW